MSPRSLRTLFEICPATWTASDSAEERFATLAPCSTPAHTTPDVAPLNRPGNRTPTKVFTSSSAKRRRLAVYPYAFAVQSTDEERGRRWGRRQARTNDQRAVRMMVCPLAARPTSVPVARQVVRETH